MQCILWLADRDGMPLAGTTAPVGRTRQSMSEADADAEAETVRATLSAARTVVNLNASVPSAAVIARWHQLGERWVAGTRKTARVITGGAASKPKRKRGTTTIGANRPNLNRAMMTVAGSRRRPRRGMMTTVASSRKHEPAMMGKAIDEVFA